MKCAGDGMCIDPRCQTHSPPEMRALCGEPVPLTHEKLDKLLDAYAGAMSHLAWAREHSTVAMHAIACDAAVEARDAIRKAVFG